MPGMRSLLAVLILSAAIVAAGCGGGSSSSSSGGLAGRRAPRPRPTTGRTASARRSSPGTTRSPTRARGSGTTRRKTASRPPGTTSAAPPHTLADDLRGLGRPDTESGQEAKAAIDELATSLETSMQKITDAIDNASGASALGHGRLDDRAPRSLRWGARSRLRRSSSSRTSTPAASSRARSSRPIRAQGLQRLHSRKPCRYHSEGVARPPPAVAPPGRLRQKRMQERMILFGRAEFIGRTARLPRSLVAPCAGGVTELEKGGFFPPLWRGIIRA